MLDRRKSSAQMSSVNSALKTTPAHRTWEDESCEGLGVSAVAGICSLVEFAVPSFQRVDCSEPPVVDSCTLTLCALNEFA